MAKHMKHQVPAEVHHDKSEDERKYRVTGGSWEQRTRTLQDIFEFVAADKKHFLTLDSAPHTDRFDKKLVDVMENPEEVKPPRERHYWGNAAMLKASRREQGNVEIRTENKIGKSFHVQVVKIGGNSNSCDKTLKRGEYPRNMDGPGVNIGVYPGPIARAVHAVIGTKELYPMVRIQSQSRPVLYHPDGYRDVLFEIKFDRGVAMAFDGYEQDIVEVEIEVKEAPKDMSDKEIERLFDKSERIIMRKFGRDLEPISESKVAAMFSYIATLYAEDKKACKHAFKTSRFINEVFRPH